MSDLPAPSAPPDTIDEYNRLQNERIRYFGRGPDTGMEVPCPRCCAPAFQKWYVWPTHPENVEAVTSKGAVCNACGFGCRAIYARGSGSVQFEMVQTAGPELPDYMPPMRRDPDLPPPPAAA